MKRGINIVELSESLNTKKPNMSFACISKKVPTVPTSIRGYSFVNDGGFSASYMTRDSITNKGYLRGLKKGPCNLVPQQKKAPCLKNHSIYCY